MGLRQTFPVQMNKIVFIQRKIQSESSTILRQS